MVYREIQPHAHLQPWVHCYWELEGVGPEVQNIYPDGRAEIVFHYGDAFTFNGAKQAKALFAGQLTTAIRVSPSGVAGVFGVRFTPAGAWGLLRFSQSETLDTIIPLCDVCRDFEKATAERIFNAGSTGERVCIVERRLRWMAPDAPGAMEVLAAAISEGTMTTREARQSSNIGERQWERLFRKRTGLRPKLLERIGRFRRALQLAGQGLAWVDVAQHCHYADQAHMVRDFRLFTGSSPTRIDGDWFA